MLAIGLTSNWLGCLHGIFVDCMHTLFPKQTRMLSSFWWTVRVFPSCGSSPDGCNIAQSPCTTARQQSHSLLNSPHIWPEHWHLLPPPGQWNSWAWGEEGSQYPAEVLHQLNHKTSEFIPQGRALPIMSMLKAHTIRALQRHIRRTSAETVLWFLQCYFHCWCSISSLVVT